MKRVKLGWHKVEIIQVRKRPCVKKEARSMKYFKYNFNAKLESRPP